MVALPGAPEADERKDVVERVDAEDVEPIADALDVLETQVPTGGAVRFAQGSAKAELVYQQCDLDGVAGSTDNFCFVDGQPSAPADFTDSQVVIGAQLIYAF